MAEKNVYFFKVRLYDESGNSEYDYKLIPDIIKDLFNNSKHTKSVGKIKVLDITGSKDKLHTTLDIYRYQYDHLFLRASKQKPKSSTIVRDYDSLQASPILPGVNENQKGIEQYTYIYMDYNSGILSIVQAQGAPDEKSISVIFDMYCRGYSLKLEQIPNIESYKRIYSRDHSEISKVNLCIPTADPVILEQILGSEGKRLFDAYSSDNIQITVSINAKVKRGKLTYNTEDSHTLLDCIKNKLGYFSNASVNASCDGEKSREYTFCETIFKFPINVSISHKENGKEVNYTSDELVQIYYEELKKAFNSSRDYVILIANR